MKINEVPQDKEAFKGKSDIRKLMYATNNDGSYTQVNSEGWEVENMATKQAWESVIEELAELEKQVKAGVISPLPYFMQKALMELPVLARYMGKWKWQVKRHFKPEIFGKLDNNTLRKYSDVLGVSVEELTQFGK